jgi:hypothetical protein
MADTYGPELIVNGGFDTDLSGWTQSPTDKWEWASGRAYQPYDPNTDVELRQLLSAPLDIDELYEVTITFEYVRSQGDAGVLYMSFRNASAVRIMVAAALGVGESGTYTGRFRTPYIDAIQMIEFSQSGLVNFECYLDDISLKQVTPDPSNPNLPPSCTGSISTGGGGGGDGVDEDGNTICLTGNDWGDNDCGADGTPTWEDPCATPQ